MTCKDCINYEKCGGSLTNDLVPCDLFKNKANFVEIPCKCKECEHFNNYNPDETYCEEHSDGWGDNRVYVDEDDYCSFGIKKKGGEDNG